MSNLTREFVPSIYGERMRLTPEVVDFKVGLFRSRSGFGRGLQSLGTYYLPGDTSAIRHPVRSGLYQALTPGGGGGGGGRLGRRIGGERDYIRCPAGFEFGGRFGRNCGRRTFTLPGEGVSSGIERQARNVQRVADAANPDAPRGRVREIVGTDVRDSAVQIQRSVDIPTVGGKNAAKQGAGVSAAANAVVTNKKNSSLLVRRDGVTLAPSMSIEELGRLKRNADMENGIFVVHQKNQGVLGEKEIPAFLSSDLDGVVFAFPGGGRLNVAKKRSLTPSDRRRLSGAFKRGSAAGAEMDYDAGIVAMVDASAGALSYDGRFPGIKRPYERVTVESAEGQRRSVARWVYEIFLSVSAPQRGGRKSWSIVESPVDVALEKNAEKSAFGGSVLETKQNLIEFRTSSFQRESDFASYVFQVKRVAAVWDADLPPQGGFRCPPGTRYGGRITDRFGRNCGWNVGRRLANRLEQVGRGLGNRLDDRRDRQVNERIARQARRQEGRVNRARRGVDRAQERLRRAEAGERFPILGRRGRNAERVRQGRAAERMRRREERAGRLREVADRLDYGEGRGRDRRARDRAEARRRGRARRGEETAPARKLTQKDREDLIDMVDYLDDDDPRRQQAIDRLRADGFNPDETTRIRREPTVWARDLSDEELLNAITDFENNKLNPNRAGYINEARRRGLWGNGGPNDPKPQNWAPNESLLDMGDREGRRRRRGERAGRLGEIADRLDYGEGRGRDRRAQERADQRAARRLDRRQRRQEARQRRVERRQENRARREELGQQRQETRRQRRGQRAERLRNVADRLDYGEGRERDRRAQERANARRERRGRRAERLNDIADRLDYGEGRGRDEEVRQRREARRQQRMDRREARRQRRLERRQRRNERLRDVADRLDYGEGRGRDQRARDNAEARRRRRDASRVERGRTGRRAPESLTDEELNAELSDLRSRRNDLSSSERQRLLELTAEDLARDRRDSGRGRDGGRFVDETATPSTVVPDGRQDGDRLEAMSDDDLEREAERLQARIDKETNPEARDEMQAQKDAIDVELLRRENNKRIDGNSDFFPNSEELRNLSDDDLGKMIAHHEELLDRNVFTDSANEPRFVKKELEVLRAERRRREREGKRNGRRGRRDSALRAEEQNRRERDVLTRAGAVSENPENLTDEQVDFEKDLLERVVSNIDSLKFTKQERIIINRRLDALRHEQRRRNGRRDVAQNRSDRRRLAVGAKAYGRNVPYEDIDQRVDNNPNDRRILRGARADALARAEYHKMMAKDALSDKERAEHESLQREYEKMAEEIADKLPSDEFRLTREHRTALEERERGLESAIQANRSDVDQKIADIFAEGRRLENNPDERFQRLGRAMTELAQRYEHKQRMQRRERIGVENRREVEVRRRAIMQAIENDPNEADRLIRDLQQDGEQLNNLNVDNDPRVKDLADEIQKVASDLSEMRAARERRLDASQRPFDSPDLVERDRQLLRDMGLGGYYDSLNNRIENAPDAATLRDIGADAKVVRASYQRNLDNATEFENQREYWRLQLREIDRAIARVQERLAEFGDGQTSAKPSTMAENIRRIRNAGFGDRLDRFQANRQSAFDRLDQAIATGDDDVIEVAYADVQRSLMREAYDIIAAGGYAAVGPDDPDDLRAIEDYFNAEIEDISKRLAGVKVSNDSLPDYIQQTMDAAVQQLRNANGDAEFDEKLKMWVQLANEYRNSAAPRALRAGRVLDRIIHAEILARRNGQRPNDTRDISLINFDVRNARLNADLVQRIGGIDLDQGVRNDAIDRARQIADRDVQPLKVAMVDYDADRLETEIENLRNAANRNHYNAVQQASSPNETQRRRALSLFVKEQRYKEAINEAEKRLRELRQRDAVRASRLEDESAAGIVDQFAGEGEQIYEQRRTEIIKRRGRVIGAYMRQRYGANKPWLDRNVNIPVEELDRLSRTNEGEARVEQWVRAVLGHDEIVTKDGTKFRTVIKPNGILVHNGSASAELTVEGFNPATQQWETVGRSTRSFNFRDKNMYSATLFMNGDAGYRSEFAKSTKDKGFQSVYNPHAWTWAKASGFKGVSVSAVADGTYVWGRMGYRSPNRNDYVRLNSRFQEEFDNFRAGRASIIKTEEDAAAVSHLLTKGREANFDPATSPAHFDFIVALGDSNDDARKAELKTWFQRNANFSAGTINLAESGLVHDDPTQFLESNEPSGLKTISAQGNSLNKNIVDPAASLRRPGVTRGGRLTDSDGPIPRPRVIENESIKTKDDAITHVKNGGDLADVPNDFIFDALVQNASEDPNDTSTRYYKVPQADNGGGAIGDTRIFVLRKEDGTPGTEGFVLKADRGLTTPRGRRLAQQHGMTHDVAEMGEVVGVNIAAALGLAPDGATWDGETGYGGRWQVIPHALNGALDGPNEPELLRGQPGNGMPTPNYASSAVDADPEAHPGAILHLLANFMLANPDRHNQNGMTFRNSRGEIQFAAIDHGWAGFDKDYAPYGLSRYLDGMWERNDSGAMFMHRRMRRNFAETYARLKRENASAAVRYRERMIATYDDAVERASAIIAGGRDEFISGQMQGWPDNITPAQRRALRNRAGTMYDTMERQVGMLRRDRDVFITEFGLNS